jgi:Skp family chaperone for outer membrane proteins
MQPNARLIATGLVCALAALQAAPLAADGVGFVNMERVFAASPQGQAVQQRLAEQFGDEQQEFAVREREIRQMQARFERDKPLMSKAQVDKTEGEIKERIKQLEKDFADIQKQVTKIQQEEGEKLLEPAQKAIAAVAKEKKITAVFEINTFDPNRAGMLYFEQGSEVDLTEDVIAALKKK